MSIKIILADDHQIMRQGLCALLKEEPEIEVVAEAEDGQTAISLARELLPDIVIMDIIMPHLNGIEATRKLIAAVPGIKVIILSMHSDTQFVAKTLETGAAGYLLKEDAFEELVCAIRTVFSGKTYLCPKVSDMVTKSYIHRFPKSDLSALFVLTPREREILQLLAEGSSTKKIASFLNVSVKTVETHRRHIMTKLDIHNVAGLTKYAIREGLTPIES